MAKKKTTSDSFGKGSILHAVIDIERELWKLEESARQHAAEMVEEAKKYRERKIEETRRRLPSLEKSEQASLLESVDERVREIRRQEEEELRLLSSVIMQNRDKAVEQIVQAVAPTWSGRIHAGEKQGI